jgi:ABC-2 type transport system permease protein
VRGLWRLTWLEIKIFLREPLGAIGTLLLPIVIFILFGRLGRGRASGGGPSAAGAPTLGGAELPIFVAIMITLSAVLSLVTIVAIYREGGILKRLRATPMRPHTILIAHVLVKLVFTVATLVALYAVGRRMFAVPAETPLLAFSVAVLFSTLSILTMGFVVASLVPVARFAQPIGAIIFYPMLVVCGLFFPVEQLTPTLRAIAYALPLTYAVSLMKGIWLGHSWLAHGTDIAALALTMAICLAISARWFRWG